MRAAVASLIALVACTRAPTAISREAAPAETARADAAIAALRGRLVTRLTDAMSAGGADAAISVCSAEAPAIAAQVAREHGVELGRTSFKLRNEANAPRPWAAQYVDAQAGTPAANAKPAVFDLGDRVGVLAPIPVGGMCLACHGPKASLTPEVSAALSAKYPTDRATGFSEGDLRGFFWAEVPRASAHQ